MKIKIINIKTLISNKVLREHIFKFFRLTKFNTEFIEVLIKVSGDNDTIFYSLSKMVTLNITNLNEKINFVDSVELKFNNLSDEYESTKTINNKIFIYYRESDKTGYRKYQRNINLYKNLDLDDGILPIKNFPYNTNYKGWGDLFPSNSSPSFYTVKNLYFDNNVEYITVNEVNYNLTEVTIYYKDNNIVFTDNITKKDKIKRTFSTGEVIFFDQNNPFFIFNSNVQKPKYKLDKKGKPTTERLDIIKPLDGSKDDNTNIRREVRIAPKIITFDIETYYDNNVFKIFKTKKILSEYTLFYIFCKLILI